MAPLSHKRCTKCGEVKPLDEFYSSPQASDGRRPDCKVCVRKRNGEYSRKIHAANKQPPSTTYDALHQHLLAHFPKTGICEECRKPAKTQHALIHGRTYSRNREDYRELCPPCHNQYDHGGELCYAAKLTLEQVAEIRQRYTPGRRTGPGTSKALAAEFGVHRNTIWNIISNRKWKTVLDALV